MKFQTTLYQEYKEKIPKEGKHILAQYDNEHILVYQAFRKSIAKYALENQEFGGPDYSYSRMSWIKPNFLWMMYRSGWAAKPGQENILGIWIKKTDFEKILANSAFTSFNQSSFETHEEWKESLEANPVRLQWDPDHSPNGEKEVRKAIQLGLKDEILEEFGKSMICEIINLSPFVESQRELAAKHPYDNLLVASEDLYSPSHELSKRIGLDSSPN